MGIRSAVAEFDTAWEEPWINYPTQVINLVLVDISVCERKSQHEQTFTNLASSTTWASSSNTVYKYNS